MTNKKNISAIYPLSPMQQGMLFHSLYAPESGVYFEQMSMNLTGNINVAAFEAAWQKVVDRYSILRTFFVWENRENPLQVVLKQVLIPWDNFDWRELSTIEQEQQLKQLLLSQRKKGFDFKQAPLMNCTIIRLGDDNYKFIWNHHHILMDGWCLSIIFKEVLSFYEAQLQGVSCQLPKSRPYSDYIDWLKSQNKSTAIEFWQQYLQGFTVPTPLVVDKTRYKSQHHSEDYDQIVCVCSTDCSQKLEKIAQQNHLTLSTIVQAAWALLLSRYSDEEDVVFGVTVSGRPPDLPGVENIVGLFINTLPLRVKVPKSSNLISWLQEIQQSMVELQQYSYTPLVDIQAICEVGGGISLFESIVVFENYPVDSSLLNEEYSFLVSNIYDFERTNYPLTIAVVAGSQLSLSINYDTTRFDQDTIERMAAHLNNLFEAIAQNPVANVDTFNLLGESERNQLLVEWNDTATEYPKDKCIHQLFAEQVEKTPDAVALVFESEELTYQQLNQRANQLAHYLQTLGVKPEVLVGICVERSIEMVVGLLGILKAGGAYVSLDPNYPQERLNYMLEDSGVGVLITQSSLLESLPQHNARVVCLDKEHDEIEQYSQENLDVGVDFDNLAYVIYTSGSTGKPKGVSVVHQGVVRLVKQTNYLNFNTQQVFLQLAPISFDASTFEIWGSLLNGAKLVVMYAHTPTLEDIAGVIEKYKVTTLWLTAALFNLMVEQQLSKLKSVRQLLAGGDVLSSFHVEKVIKFLPECELINGYGPTENTTFTCCYRVKQSTPNETSIPIGRPISNTQTYILDSHLQPVPVGVPGELYIGGDGLARGYLNRPQLTSEKFILNPFDDSKSERLYKTGDLALYLRDGNIEFLGRIDNQVKIRGFRIELGEIEAVLATHPQVNQAVVIATEENTGNKRLVAYVVINSEITTQQLREYLRAQLPDYMVPSAFVTLESLPLTPNGKVDRKALQATSADGDIVERDTEYVAPRTQSEEIIANIFAQVLNVENIGIYDNFFILGGHSLLATQLISRIRSAFSIEIPLGELFSSPTVDQLNQTITQLRNTNNGLTLPPIQPRGETKQLPLSWAQERLWFLNQLEGKSGTYNIPSAVRISGNLDINALQQALASIVQRHEVLRTSFQTENGKPIQVIDPEATVNINLVDLQQLETTKRENLVIEQAEEEAITPFDLENGPLIRCSLLQLSTSEYVFLLTMHHIVSDGWSMGVFIQELSSLYQAFIGGEVPPLEQLPIQYADFAVWQRQYLSGQVFETQLDYWKQQLNGAPDLLQLPTDYPRPTIPTYQGRTISFNLNTDLTAKLQTLSQESGTTLFMTLYAAFSTLLYRYSGQSDILIGFPIANRNRSEIEGLIGFFVNTLVLRTRFEDNPSFKKLLAQVRETTLKAYENQDVPFEQVVEALQPQRSLSYSPLFQVGFSLENVPLSEVELTGVTLSQLEQESTTAKFDLTLSISETDQGLVGKWEYNTDLFNDSTIERMIQHFQNLLQGIVEKPEQNVSSFTLISKEERHQLLVEWNDTATDYPSNKCIHQLFEQQVEENPNNLAAVFGEQQLTYQQLNQRANQLAHHLQNLGIKPEVLVGICVERNLEMVVGLLGILKAGGAYVPLDPNYPQERLSYMLADSGIGVLVTQNSLLESLPQNNARVVCLDSDWGLISQQSQESLDAGVNSDNLAYVIYTSGSTGKPKGVAIEHHSACNLAQAQTNIFDVTATSNVLQFASFSFDASVWEILMAFTRGATLVLATPSQLMPGDDLKQILHDYSITHVTLPPSALTVLPTKELPQLANIIVAGEACPLELASKWSVGRRFFNAYGPTESTVCATVTQINPSSQKITIGRPIANTQIYILDSNLQPLPIGVPGELYIGGYGLARGYLNRPQLTSEKFIQNPFSNSKSERLYKTGDLARYLSDGNIEYLGRIDNQVKIRGFRIELGEIEAVLSSHPQVNQAVVIALEENTGNKRLVAYVVANSEITTQQLREYLKAKLSEYMVPSAFVTLDSLPLTPNGKIDRKALPAPETEGNTEYIAPRTQREEILANIFAQVLNVENIGIDDNFFDLGGHSLLATQLISRVKSAFSVEIPIRILFESPTVSQLDQTLNQLGNTKTLPSIQPRSHHQELPLSWAQQRLWFLNQLEGKSATYNISTAVRISGNLDINALQKTLSSIVKRHEVLRTSFQTKNGKPIQVIDPETTIQINLVDLQQLEATQRENLVIEQAQEESTISFDLENAPLIRCSLLQLSTSEYVLLLTMHHIISDGWSMEVFTQELSNLYQAFIQGKESPLGQLPIQYGDFALWQRKYLTGQVLSTQLDYWKQQLSGAPDLLQLPTDYLRPTIQSYQGSSISFSLNIDLTTKLQKLSRESDTTLFMTLYAAFSTLLQRYSGQSDIVVGTPIANRNRSEIEGLIGFFVNTLVLRTNFENNPSFKDLLAQVRETTLKAYDHQDVPFEQVVEALQPQRSLSHSPLFQVMLVLQNTVSEDIELPGVTLSPIQLESTIAKFDLTLSITETDQGIVGEWEYNTGLFNRSTIERMAAHLKNLLEAIVENPLTKVENLNLLGESERNQLLVEWNDTATEYPKDKCIHQLFAEQVEKTPDAVAVVFEQEELTYQQLNQRANQLAHYLQTLGVKPEVLVGICVERSIEMVVGLLGILKAGGAYVSLDPNYPQERLNYMLEDSGVGVLITQSSLLESLPQHNARVVCLDSQHDEIEQYSQENLDVEVTDHNLAYVIYTSGSTGKPKGVSVVHQGVLRLVKQTNYLNFSTQQVFLQLAPISFDASTFEIWGSLLNGAKLVVMYAHTPTLEDIAGVIEKYKVTTLWLTAALFNLMVEQQLSKLKSVRQLLAGGDVLSSFHVEKVIKFLPECELINGYGPTENTTFTCCYRVKQSTPNETSIPIGRPISNTQTYILDSHLQPVPVGVPGELYIGGDGLARGYLNRPQLTSEKFILNPFDDSKSERLYKTGDLALYLRDGNIEFLGRIDNQVKIRGFRIELGEIEAVLATHPQVNQAVVIATEENTGNKRLVAYVVINSEITTQQLREYLRAQLPDYMVPSAFVTLESLPLTPNGKVDRKALQTMDADGEIERNTEYVAPRTEVEQIIANIFAQVLDLENIGIHDNFFELGGHSLLAFHLMSEMQKRFQKKLPLATLFQNPTIKQLALFLISNGETELWSTLVPIQRNGSLPPLFYVPGAGGNILSIDNLKQYLGNNQPLYGLQAQGLDGEIEPLESIEEIAQHHIKAIQTVQPTGPYFLSGYSFGGHVAFEMANQLQRMGESVAYVGILDTLAPINSINYQDYYSIWDNAKWICDMAEDLENPVVKNLVLDYETLASLTPEQQLNYFKEQLEMVGFLPPETDIKIIRGFVEVYKTQCQIKYEPQNTYSAPITLFRAREIDSEKQNYSTLLQEPALGWNQFSDPEVEVHIVPGNHISMVREPHLKVLVEKIQQSLQKAQNLQKIHGKTTS